MRTTILFAYILSLGISAAATETKSAPDVYEQQKTAAAQCGLGSCDSNVSGGTLTDVAPFVIQSRVTAILSGTDSVGSSGSTENK